MLLLRISHVLKKETRGWRRPGCDVEFWTAFAFEEFSEIVFSNLAGSDLYEDPNYTADHAPEEVRCFNSKRDDLFFRFDRSILDNNDGGFIGPRGILGAEADKIMSTSQHLRRSLHRF